MNLKEYKEKKEAKAYFRSNNSYFFSTNDLIKFSIITLITGIGVGFVYAFFERLVPISFSFVIVAIGGLVGYILQTLAQRKNNQLAIMAVVGTVLAYYVSQVLTYYYNFGGLVKFSAIMGVAFTSMFRDIFSLVCVICGCVLAYKMND